MYGTGPSARACFRHEYGGDPCLERHVAVWRHIIIRSVPTALLSKVGGVNTKPPANGCRWQKSKMRGGSMLHVLPDVRLG